MGRRIRVFLQFPWTSELCSRTAYLCFANRINGVIYEVNVVDANGVCDLLACMNSQIFMIIWHFFSDT